MKRIIFSFLLVFSASILAAQDGLTVHFLRHNPYSSDINPATTTPYTGHIGLPILSSIDASLTNTSLHYNKIFGFGEDGSTITTLKLLDVTDKMSPNCNAINSNISLNILDFSTQMKAFKFSFDYRIRFDEYFIFSKDLFGLLTYGNMHYTGEDNQAQLKGILNINAYQEFAFGFQFNLSEKVSLGIRPKLLFGIANVRTNSANATLYTNPDDYSLMAQYSLDASLMSVLPITIDKNNKFNLNLEGFSARNLFQNAGASIDIGTNYRINDKFGISTAVLDLGFISWRTNGLKFNGSIDTSRTLTNNGSFIFNGLTSDNLAQLKDNPSAIKDTLLTYFPISHNTIDKYNQALSGHFIVEGYYYFNKNQRLSLLFQGRLVNKYFLPSFTIAWDADFGNILDLCVNYTLARKSYANIGIGIGLNFGAFHIYAATDNIIGFFNTKSIQRSLLNTSNANARLGIYFSLGKIAQKTSPTDAPKDNTSIEPKDNKRQLKQDRSNQD